MRHALAAHLGVAHAMLFTLGMKPLLILLILALGPALGDLTSPVPASPVVGVSSVSDVHQLPDDASASVEHPAVEHTPRS